MYLFVEFDYGAEWGKFTQEQWDEIRIAVPTLQVDKPSWTPPGVHLITHDAIPTLVKFKLTFHLSESDESKGVGSMLVKLQDQIARLEMRGKSDAELISAGAAVQIVIPDMPLMFVNEVTHLDDCCTDRLQDHLTNGWRILAVCPPNAQRRPDYILGRHKATP